LASILHGRVSARLRHHRPQGRVLLLVLRLLLLVVRLGHHRLLLELLLLVGLLLKLLLDRLLLVGYLLLEILILEGTLDIVIRAAREGMLMLERLGGGGKPIPHSWPPG
jgi:hypothetical protein